jgi:hypothetical protein
MRKILPVVLVVLLVCSFLPRAQASSLVVVKLWIGKTMMLINDRKTAIDNQGTVPYILAARTMVPVRAIIEAFGGTIAWEPTTKQITIKLGNGTLKLWIDNPTANLNGKDFIINPTNYAVVPLIKDGRTFLPLRFVSESLSVLVDFDEQTSMITLTYVR